MATRFPCVAMLPQATLPCACDGSPYSLPIVSPDGSLPHVTTCCASTSPDAILLGLPDPFSACPPGWLRLCWQPIHYSRRPQLENILVGPGNLVWLIDFRADPRWSHLVSISLTCKPRSSPMSLLLNCFPEDYLSLIQASPLGEDSSRIKLRTMYSTIFDIASRCLFNPSQPREFHLALALACLGALKHTNLDAHARQFLYMTAAELSLDL